jgi:cysteine desulfurase/selenocysteine lyase
LIQNLHTTDGRDIETVRKEFPILSRSVHGKPLVYLDNGATSQKPVAVIDAVSEYYKTFNSNVHRGVHTLSQLATDAYEKAREEIRILINARSSKEVIITRGTTTSINTVAFSLGRKILKPGDSVLISTVEHHANIVPWQMICEQTGANLRVIPMLSTGEPDLEAFRQLLTQGVKILALTHVSNTLGIIHPVKECCSIAREHGVITLIDGAQAIQHTPVDVQDLGCDFYCFSGHKMYAPSGIGILYGREEVLSEMPPHEGGGDMIRDVSFEKTEYNDLPFRFEAGTPNIEGAVGLSEAVQYIRGLGWDFIRRREKYLLDLAMDALSEIQGIRFFGHVEEKASVISFLVGDAHPYDTGMILDKCGVAVRTGHHCTMPLMKHLGIPGTVRATFSFYNTEQDIKALVDAVRLSDKMLNR